jgi:3-phosphoshikimate 1-carboxyvinyltransferase
MVTTTRKTDIALSGEIIIAPDKSISHRSIIFASLANGKSKIYNLLEGEDVLKTAQALRLMGAEIKRFDTHWEVNGVGVAGLSEPVDVLDMGNSGTAARPPSGCSADSTPRASPQPSQWLRPGRVRC